MTKTMNDITPRLPKVTKEDELADLILEVNDCQMAYDQDVFNYEIAEKDVKMSEDNLKFAQFRLDTFKKQNDLTK